MMFSSTRKAHSDAVIKEIEYQRTENTKPVRVPRKFGNIFKENSFVTRYGYEMKFFETTRLNQRDDEILFFVHGGAFMYQPVFFHWRFLHSLALRTHLPIVMPIYPKVPHHNCEFAIKTLLEFYLHLIEERNPKKIYFAGDSAGGCIALALAEELKIRSSKTPEKIILLSPCLDLSYSQEEMMMRYQDSDPMILMQRLQVITGRWADNLPLNHPWVSPVFGCLEGIGEITLFVGTNEILIADARMLKKRLEDNNIRFNYHEVHDMFHTFAMFPVKEGFLALKEIAHALNEG